MPDKTPLEFDLEHHEKFRTPARVKTVIVLLLISLCFLGVYTIKIKQELAKIEQETVVLKSNFRKEKVELLRKIKWLEAKQDSRLDTPHMGLIFRDKALSYSLKGK
jgi:hypothetical protein